MKNNSDIASKQPKTNSSSFFFIVLAALMAFTSLSTDVYLPAMPQMQIDLHGDAELTITGFLIGFAIGQIFWGPISDKYGRKLPLVIGLILFVIGSVCCALSYDIKLMIVGRIIQALGACVGPMLARAMVRDKYESNKSAEVLSSLVILMAIAPIIGPLMGGQVLKFSSWHTIFWGLGVIAIVILLAVFKLNETLLPVNRSRQPLLQSYSTYFVLLKNKTFMRYTLSVTFYYIGVYAFIAGSPFVYITYYKVPPQYYGWLFALNIVGVMILSFINRKLVTKYKLHDILKVSVCISIVAGLMLAIFSIYGIGKLWGIVLPIFIFFSMNGIIAATSTAAALDGVPEIAGAASALLGALQYGIGILSSLLLAWFSDGTPKTMSLIIAISTVLAFIPLLLKKH